MHLYTIYKDFHTLFFYSENFNIFAFIINKNIMTDKFKIYTVYRGDTPESIAESQGISTEELLEYNNISDPTSL